ncbi:amidohydrolase family protein [Streptosporangium sp. DT93]|uniref:amidohydrolase family protein n=1 Tax=Streptosporangium sp. DT93 TaxID=3393428 RepID=UPI003CEDE334
MVIDVWAQPVPSERPGRLAAPEITRLFEKSGSAELLRAPLGPDELAGLMDEAGVDLLLLSAWHRPGGWVISNDDVAAFVRARPDRFAGVASVDLSRPVAAVRELRRAVGELGFVGLRVVPWLWDLPPDHRLYYPLYAACVELGLPFCTQAGHTGPLMPSEPGRPVPYLDRVALDFPELTIVAGHIGHPWTEEMIGVAWKHDNVYIDTSAHLPRYYPGQLVHFMNTYGRGKVMFGTNWPQLPHAEALAQVASLPLTDEARADFLGGTARRVFRLPGGRVPRRGR